MERILYNAMNGSQIDFNRQSVNSNNLANANTPGFKAEIFQAQSQYLTTGGKTGHALARQKENGIDFTNGPLRMTGRDLDVAIQGDGWFSVQDKNGNEAYTRAGNFQIDQNGVLTTASGNPVLGDGGPISIPPAQHVEIGSDGTISIVPLDAEPNALAVLDRLKLVKPSNKDLVKNEEGLLRLKTGGTAEPDASITTVRGAIEESNVKPIEQMVNMIAAGREYEAQMKMMQSVNENTRELAQVLQE